MDSRTNGVICVHGVHSVSLVQGFTKRVTLRLDVSASVVRTLPVIHDRASVQ